MTCPVGHKVLLKKCRLGPVNAFPVVFLKSNSNIHQSWAVWSDLQVKYLLTPRWGPKLRAGTGISASWRVNAYQSYYEIEVDDGLTSYSELNIHTIRQRSFSYGVPLSIGLDFPLPGPWFVGVEARGAFFFNLDDALSASVRVGRYF